MAEPSPAMAGVATTDDGRSCLVSLLTLFSPAFPIGAFAWSHGIEAAIAEDRLAAKPATGPDRAGPTSRVRSVSPRTTAADVADWIETLLDRGSGWNDGVLLVEAFRACVAGDRARFEAAADLAEALAGSAERRAETLALGTAFAEAAMPWMVKGQTEGASEGEGGRGGEAAEGRRYLPGRRRESSPDHAPLAYPVAVGRLAATAGLPLAETLAAFAHGFAASLVSAAVRLVPLAQSDAVRILHRLEPVIADFSARAKRSTLDDLGSVALGSDIAAMRHETLATRLFRS